MTSACPSENTTLMAPGNIRFLPDGRNSSPGETPPCRVRVILEKPTFSVLPLDRLEAGLCLIMGHWLRHMASQNSGVPEEDRTSLSFRKARSLAIPCCCYPALRPITGISPSIQTIAACPWFACAPVYSFVRPRSRRCSF